MRLSTDTGKVAQDKEDLAKVGTATTGGKVRILGLESHLNQ